MDLRGKYSRSTLHRSPNSISANFIQFVYLFHFNYLSNCNEINNDIYLKKNIFTKKLSRFLVDVFPLRMWECVNETEHLKPLRYSVHRASLLVSTCITVALTSDIGQFSVSFFYSFPIDVIKCESRFLRFACWSTWRRASRRWTPANAYPIASGI